jgi:hypothetical protein
LTQNSYDVERRSRRNEREHENLKDVDERKGEAECLAR